MYLHIYGHDINSILFVPAQRLHNLPLTLSSHGCSIFVSHFSSNPRAASCRAGGGNLLNEFAVKDYSCFHVCAFAQVTRKKNGETVEPTGLSCPGMLCCTWPGNIFLRLCVFEWLKMPPKRPCLPAEPPRWVQLGINKPPEPVALMHVKQIEADFFSCPKVSNV